MHVIEFQAIQPRYIYIYIERNEHILLSMGYMLGEACNWSGRGSFARKALCKDHVVLVVPEMLLVLCAMVNDPNSGGSFGCAAHENQRADCLFLQVPCLGGEANGASVLATILRVKR